VFFQGFDCKISHTFEQNPLQRIHNFNLFESCPVDPSHTIWYGLVINVLELFRNRVLTPDQRLVVDRRLLYYPWPSGCQRITFNIGSSRYKRWSMAQYKNIALVMPPLFWRVLDSDHFDLLLDVMEIIQFFAATSYTLKAVSTFIL
jgi:hypothetical protein